MKIEDMLQALPSREDIATAIGVRARVSTTGGDRADIPRFERRAAVAHASARRRGGVLRRTCASGRQRALRPDPTVQTLARLFREHPAWVDAARHLADGSESDVFFSHLPGRSWHLMRRRGETLLLRGRAHDPDFAFCFTPAAVARLAAVKGDVGDFAVELFSRILDPREGRRIGFRVIAPFARLARRGYVRLLLAAGPKIVAFRAARGVRTLGELRRLVGQMRQRDRHRRREETSYASVSSSL